MPDGMEEALTSVQEEAERFIRGDRSQLDAFQQDEKEKWETAEVEEEAVAEGG